MYVSLEDHKEQNVATRSFLLLFVVQLTNPKFMATTSFSLTLLTVQTKIICPKMNQMLQKKRYRFVVRHIRCVLSTKAPSHNKWILCGRQLWVSIYYMAIKHRDMAGLHIASSFSLVICLSSPRTAREGVSWNKSLV